MVKIGNINVGKAESAKIDMGEAFLLSQHLYYRHFCLEQTKQHYHLVKDLDFRVFIKRGIDYIEKETAEIEKQMQKHKVPQPSRSPKSVMISLNKDCDFPNDQHIFEQVRQGCGAAIEKNTRNAFMIINNDSLRDMFLNFVKEEMDLLSNLLKFGKIKGWTPVYPAYKAD